MQTGGAAKRYAQAIFSLASETQSFDAWQRDLDLMAQLVSDQTGRALFESPKVSTAQKRRVVEQFVGQRLQPHALSLMRLLIDRERFVIVDRIAAAFADLVRESRGVAIAEVTTAVPLEPEASREVERLLGARVGKRIDLRTHVDPSLIGGIVARVGDYLIDGSVTGQLRRLRSRLAEGR